MSDAYGGIAPLSMPCTRCGAAFIPGSLCRWDWSTSRRPMAPEYLCDACCPYCNDPRHSLALDAQVGS